MRSFTCYPVQVPNQTNDLLEAFRARGDTLYDPLVVQMVVHENPKRLQANVYLRGKLVAHSATQEVE